MQFTRAIIEQFRRLLACLLLSGGILPRKIKKTLVYDKKKYKGELLSKQITVFSIELILT